MKTPLTRLLSLSIAVALVACPSAAVASEGAVVPPSNSAATQYTEAFPTSGGEKKTDQAHRRSPSKVLGGKKAHKLEQQGPDGKAAAEAAAATAPTPVAPTTATQPTNAPSASHRSGNGGSGKGGSNSGKNAAGPGQNQGQGQNAPSGSPSPATGVNSNPQVTQPSGSSGLGSAVGEATGFSSSGQSSALLILVIIATILLSLGYLWRHRQELD